MIHLGIWHCVNVPQSLRQEAKSWTSRGVKLCFYIQWLKKTVMLKKWNELVNNCLTEYKQYRTVLVNITPAIVVLSEFFRISALESRQFDSLAWAVVLWSEKELFGKQRLIRCTDHIQQYLVQFSHQIQGSASVMKPTCGTYDHIREMGKDF